VAGVAVRRMANEATQILGLREHMIGREATYMRYCGTAPATDAQSGGIDTMETFNGLFSQKQNPHYLESDNKPELDLLEKDELKAKRPSMWNIVFYNDDYTPMEFVEFVLKTIFHISTLDALALTLAVHTQGKGIAGTYTFEIAEQKRCEVLLLAKVEEHPLRVEAERV
jgi:ATP-dependent Clp protease adaptor protein ClpS